MPKKKSIDKAATRFIQAVEVISEYVETVSDGQSAAHVSAIHDHGIIWLYKEFENMVLEVLAGAINNDTRTVSDTLGIEFPKHLNAHVCYFLITGPSYFDFKGRSGLIKRIKQYVPGNHFLVRIVKKEKYKNDLELLCTLRNYAAHGSEQSKTAALKAIDQTRLPSSGTWLKKQGRFPKIAGNLSRLAEEIQENAPY